MSEPSLDADLKAVWNTCHWQRLLGIGIAALAFAPLVENAAALWNGSGLARLLFIVAVGALAGSVVFAQRGLHSQRGVAVGALYLRWNKGAEGSPMVIRSGNQFHDDFAKLEQWLGRQYWAAVLGAAAMVFALASAAG